MNHKLRIIVAGIGGVGGYFGGLLAKKYQDSNEVEIDFVARGWHLKQIKHSGLKVIKGTETFTAIPAFATDYPAELGIADYLLICTKSYDLEAILEQLKPCIDECTIVLPLLNGVDGAERIKTILPNITVLNGCVYIVSRLKEAGVIENMGNIQKLYFGLENTKSDKLIVLEKLLIAADIEATLSENIAAITWEKFIYISSIATATCYYDNCIGELLGDDVKRETLYSLIEEVAQIALAKGVITDPEIITKTRNKLKLFPYESTCSMHSDFKNRKRDTELETLTGYVVREGIQMGIATPNFDKAYNALINKTKKMH